MKNKRKFARRRHTKRRAIERYSLYLNRSDLYEIVKIIQRGKTNRCLKSSNGKSIHELEYKGINIIVVYSKTHKEIKTILPNTDRHY